MQSMHAKRQQMGYSFELCLHLFSASVRQSSGVACNSRTELSAMFGVRKRFTCWVLFPICSNSGRHRQMVIVSGCRFSVFSGCFWSCSLSKYAVRQMSIQSNGRMHRLPQFYASFGVFCAMFEFSLQIERKTIII